MLKINAAQLMVLNKIKLNDFYDTCIKCILNIDELDLKQSNLNEIIIQQDLRALKEFKITEEKWRFSFMVLSLQYNLLTQKQYPFEIIEILTWPDRKSETKIQLLRHHLESGINPS